MKSLLVLLLMLSVTLVGCPGPTDRCQLASACSADPKRTSADIKSCQDAEKNPPRCHTEKAAFEDCFLAHAVCGSDNKTDPLQTFTACTAESEAFQKCNMM